MDDALRMDGIQAVEQAGQPGEQLGLPESPPLPQQHVEARAFLVLHDHAGRAEVLEDVVDTHDVRVFEARQGARFDEEAPQAGRILRCEFGRQRPDGVVRLAPGEVAGQVLLDRDGPVQVVVHRKVGDAERPLAQYALDAVPEQAGAGRQRGAIGAQQ